MKIELGEWKTRDGRKAIVAAYNKDAHFAFVGWINGDAVSWMENGSWASELGSRNDLISPWTDPVPWDWSTTPPWINWIAMDSNDMWWMYCSEPKLDSCKWNPQGASSHNIPSSHHPKWSGDWKQSKTMRPGFNGGAK